MTLEELKKLKLPVKFVCEDGHYIGSLKEITLTAFNGLAALITASGGYDSYLYLDSILDHYKVAPNTKIIEREYWLNIYGNTMVPHTFKEVADKASRGNDRLFCKHIKIKIEVDATTGEFIRESAE